MFGIRKFRKNCSVKRFFTVFNVLSLRTVSCLTASCLSQVYKEDFALPSG